MKICLRWLTALWLAACLLMGSALAERPDWDVLLVIPAEDVPAGVNPTERMAHNVYSDPDLSGTSGRFDGFMIDFRADRAACGTYWALCNWRMNKDELMSRRHVEDPDAGAYAGLQLRPDGPKAILSFWEIGCVDDSGEREVIEARRVYPAEGDTDRFGGEGEGTHYICDYPWREGAWYRMYLGCYQDGTGRTFVEQWIADLASGAWTLICRFDTGLYGSFFEGDMSQFMENYDSAYANETRTFEYRNIRVREYGSVTWTAVGASRLSVDTWWDNKKGGAAFGAQDDRFWGIANGCGPDAFVPDEVVGETFTVNVTGDVYMLPVIGTE